MEKSLILLIISIINRVLIAVVGIGWSFVGFVPTIMMSDSGDARKVDAMNLGFVSLFLSFAGGIVGGITNSWWWLLPGSSLQIVTFYIYDHPDGIHRDIQKFVSSCCHRLSHCCCPIASDEERGEDQPLIS
jgi:hypothetical protein